MRTYYVRLFWRGNQTPTTGTMKAANLPKLRKVLIKDGLSRDDKIARIHIWNGQTGNFLGKMRKVGKKEYEWSEETVSGSWSATRSIHPRTGELKPKEE